MLRKLSANSKNLLGRALYLLAVLSFVLPFVTVYTTSCERVPGQPTKSTFVRTGESRNYYGYQLITKSASGWGSGWFYLLPISLGLLFFALTFFGQYDAEVLRGFVKSWKAALSSLAAICVLFLPSLQLWPSDVEARIGQQLASACWVLIYAASLTGALIFLVNARRSGACGASDKPMRFPALRVAYSILILPAIAIFAYLTSQVVIGSRKNLRTDAGFLATAASFVVPMFLVAYFLERGLQQGETWAVRSGRWALWLLAVGGFLSVVVGGLLGGDTGSRGSRVLLVWLLAVFLAGIGGLLLAHRWSSVNQVQVPPN